MLPVLNRLFNSRIFKVDRFLLGFSQSSFQIFPSGCLAFFLFLGRSKSFIAFRLSSPGLTPSFSILHLASFNLNPSFLMVFHCQCPFCVMKAVFSRSSFFIGIDQNAELMSNVEKKWQIPALTMTSSILGNGCDSGTTILFISRKSIQSLSLRFDSFLNASVTGAANGELDSSMRSCSSNFVIWNYISF